MASNHFLRQTEPFDPLMPYSNGLDDLFGLVHVAGSNNTVAPVPVRTVVLDGATSGTKVLDCGTPSEFQAHGSPHSFRPTP